ncbi:MAG: hypothetical protein EA378_02035 [Phycisphaerales bacterium]|nr:MAG: hypothetical protein EA378_02035 [Phycisphaerales bacterium]
MALCRTSPIIPDVPPTLIAMLPHAVFMLGIFAMFGWLALDQFVLVPLAARAAVLTVVVIGVLWLLWRQAARAYRRGVSVAPVPHKPDPTARVNIALYADQLNRLLPLRDEVFEPEVFWRLGVPVSGVPEDAGSDDAGASSRSAQAARFGTVLQVLWVAACVAVMIFLPSGWVQTAVLVGGAGIVLAVRYRRPTYLRVVPGRLDIMRQPTLGLGWGLGLRPTIESIDLRTPRVLVDLRSAQVLLHPVYDRHPGPLATDAQREAYRVRAARQRILNLGTTPSREAAMLAIARAAASSAEPPPLPEDRFTD